MRARTSRLKSRSRVTTSPPRLTGVRPQLRPHGRRDDCSGSESVLPFASARAPAGTEPLRLGADPAPPSVCAGRATPSTVREWLGSGAFGGHEKLVEQHVDLLHGD